MGMGRYAVGLERDKEREEGELIMEGGKNPELINLDKIHQEKLPKYYEFLKLQNILFEYRFYFESYFNENLIELIDKKTKEVLSPQSVRKFSFHCEPSRRHVRKTYHFLTKTDIQIMLTGSQLLNFPINSPVPSLVLIQQRFPNSYLYYLRSGTLIIEKSKLFVFLFLPPPPPSFYLPQSFSFNFIHFAHSLLKLAILLPPPFNSPLLLPFCTFFCNFLSPPPLSIPHYHPLLSPLPDR